MPDPSSVELSVAFLSFLFIFSANMARFSLRDGVFIVPFADRVSREREPRKFYVALGVSLTIALVCLAAVSGYVLKAIA
jgi:hypothetical protein